MKLHEIRINYSMSVPRPCHSAQKLATAPMQRATFLESTCLAEKIDLNKTYSINKKTYNDCMPVQLYHLLPAAVWALCKESQRPYFPPTYEQDGFTHLTADPSLLMEVANHFYKGECGDWLVLALDASKLAAEVKFEPAALVGDRPSHGLVPGNSPPLFPHLYGSIDFDAVTAELPVQRSADGTFISVSSM